MDYSRKLEKIGEVDVAAVVSSLNNAPTIAFVLHNVAQGLRAYFPDKKSVIINVDGCSRDGCTNVTRAINLPVKKIVVREEQCNGMLGKGAAIKTGLEIADRLNARAIALFDSDLRSINPEWVKLLVEPIEDGKYDFISPYYLRYKYDGTITNFIGYPLVRTLFGIRLRQPIGGEFGLSRKCYKRVLKHPLWSRPEMAQFGIDFFVTGVSLGEKLRTSEAVLGIKVHDVKDPSKHLAPMFRQVVGSILGVMEYYDGMWPKIRRSKPLRRHRGGIRFSHPEPFDVDTQDMINIFLGGRARHTSLLKSMLPNEIYRILASVPVMREEFIFDTELWFKIMYHSIAAYFSAAEEKKLSILDALRCMWMGRLAYFTIESKDLSNREAEHIIEEQSLVFEENKQMLVELYNTVKKKKKR